MNENITQEQIADLEANLEALSISTLTQGDKIPYTYEGIQLVSDAILDGVQKLDLREITQQLETGVYYFNSSNIT